jgi:glycosyltransferase involved in cell wall biosynthesis
MGSAILRSMTAQQMNPLVSILIPAYNAKRWLADSLRSALEQTWDRKEIIVIDDGSTDATLSVARSFQSDIVRVFSQDHQGAAAARNNAFARSRGDYIQWLDADDQLGPDKIAVQLAALGDSPDPRTLLSAEWGKFLHRRSRARFIPTGLWCNLSPVEWLTRKMEQNAFMQTATWLVSRELTEKAGPWDTRLLGDDDGEYFCRVLMAAKEVRFVPGAKVYYRQPRSSNLSYIGECDRKRDAMWLSMKLHVGDLRSMDDSQRSRAACLKYLQNFLVSIHPERPDLVSRTQKLAQELGGSLELPRFSRLFACANKLFGWRASRKMQRWYQRCRLWLLRNLDKLPAVFFIPVFRQDEPITTGNGTLNTNKTESNGVPMRSAH